jgi:EAL and modified HD-GYP domain-containing signal transduction protein
MTELPVHFLNDAPVPAAGPADRGMIARQAIVNGMQQIIGYELFNRSRAYPDHTAASDVSLVFTALSHAGEEDLVGTKLMFVNCTHESLAGGHLELLNPDKVVLEIPPPRSTAAPAGSWPGIAASSARRWPGPHGPVHAPSPAG